MEMKQKHQQEPIHCPVCKKGPFSNGKAMGGHLRSHYQKHPLPPKPITSTSSTISSITSTRVLVEEDRNPSFKAPSLIKNDTNPNCSSPPLVLVHSRSMKTNTNNNNNNNNNRDEAGCRRSSNLVIRDCESATKPRPNLDDFRVAKRPNLDGPTSDEYRDGDDEEEEVGEDRTLGSLDTRRRSKRQRRVAETKVSSNGFIVNDNNDDDRLSDIEAANCLLKLLVDKRFRYVNNNDLQLKRGRVEDLGYNKVVRDDEEEEEEEVEEDEEKEEEEPRPLMKSKKSREYRYTCEICKKGFSTKQAKGGHIASHKRNKTYIPKTNNSSPSNDSGGIEQQVNFECPFCDKVFKSGQALGGHKKVHFMHSSSDNYVLPRASASPVRQDISRLTTNNKLLDLNLPATEEDDNVNENEYVDDDVNGEESDQVYV